MQHRTTTCLLRQWRSFGGGFATMKCDFKPSRTHLLESTSEWSSNDRHRLAPMQKTTCFSTCCLNSRNKVFHISNFLLWGLSDFGNISSPKSQLPKALNLSPSCKYVSNALVPPPHKPCLEASQEASMHVVSEEEEEELHGLDQWNSN